MNEGQNTLTLSIDGDPCRVPVGISVAAALSLWRRSLSVVDFTPTACPFAAWAFVRSVE